MLKLKIQELFIKMVNINYTDDINYRQYQLTKRKFIFQNGDVMLHVLFKIQAYGETFDSVHKYLPIASLV